MKAAPASKDSMDIRAPSFTSMGGVWLDEIKKSNITIAKDIVGGSATYAILGARLFNSTTPYDLQLIVNAGEDFPESVLEQLRTWEVRIHIIKHDDKPSTRGVLEHKDDGGKFWKLHPTKHAKLSGSIFTRLTPPLLTQPEDLDAIGALDSKILHIFGDPSLAQDQINTIHRLRENKGLSTNSRPMIIWEPHPKTCTAEHYDEYVSVLKTGAITVFSPNHHELRGLCSARLFGPNYLEQSLLAPSPSFEDMIIAMARSLRSDSMRPEMVLVIRAAEHGSLTLLPYHDMPIWLPAYFDESEQTSVVDTTGAGNAFLGGLAQGWLDTGDWLTAVSFATVAASIVVQQIGVPTVSRKGKTELWHNLDVTQRLVDYSRRRDVRDALRLHGLTT